MDRFTESMNTSVHGFTPQIPPKPGLGRTEHKNLKRHVGLAGGWWNPMYWSSCPRKLGSATEPDSNTGTLMWEGIISSQVFITVPTEQSSCEFLSIRFAPALWSWFEFKWSGICEVLTGMFYKHIWKFTLEHRASVRWKVRHPVPFSKLEDLKR